MSIRAAVNCIGQGLALALFSPRTIPQAPVIHELPVEEVLNRYLTPVVHGERCAARYGWVGKQGEVGVLSDLTLWLRLAGEGGHAKSDRLSTTGYILGSSETVCIIS